MKKIGILTLVFDNYGTRLQSYALVNALKSILNYDVEIQVINMEACWSNRGLSPFVLFGRAWKAYGLKAIPYMYNWVSYILQSRKMANDPGTQKSCANRHDLFAEIIAKIPYTEHIYSCNEIRNHKLPKYDTIIVGSDQVWNGIKVGNQDVYMLDFLTGGGRGLTYAASFGMTSIPKEMLNDYKHRINNFKTLLIREDEGVRICELLGRSDAVKVLDPTMLLERTQYESLMNGSNIIHNVEGLKNTDYVLVYSLNQSRVIFDEAYKYAKRNNCKMVVLKRSICPPPITDYEDAVELFEVSTAGFLALIKNAKCVVTNSYHALIFSIVFNSNFSLYLDNADEENSRLLSLVRMLELEETVYWQTGHLPKQIQVINYAVANKILKEQRRISLSLLKESVENELKDCK